MVSPLWKPFDGTPPFVTQSTADPDGYDSDDPFSDHNPPEGFDYYTKDQVIPPSEPVSSDKRFIWVSHVPYARPTLCKRGFEVEGADTVISLSPDEEDTLLVRSDMLREAHNVFRVGLDTRWEHNKVLESGVYGGTIKYMYELELEADGETVLVGKTAPTPGNEREEKWSTAYALFYEAFQTADFDIHDEPGLNRAMRHWVHRVQGDEYKKICIATHKVGFAILCGFPLKLYSQESDEYGRDSMLVLLLKIVEWVHMYGNFKQMGPQIERFVLVRCLSHSDSEFEHEVKASPYTLLRIATLFQAKGLFRFALARAVEKYFQDEDYWSGEYAHRTMLESLAHDHTLAEHIVRQQLKLSSTLTRIHHTLLSYRVKCQPRATWGMACTIWRNWYIRNSHPNGAPNGNTMKDIGCGWIDVNKIITSYVDVHFRKQRFPPKHVDKELLPNVLQSICDSAEGDTKELFNDSGEFMGPQGNAHWDLVGSLDFEDYTYPWQLPRGRKVSSLTVIADAVAAERG